MSITVKNTGPEIVTIACGSACITLPPGATIETTFSDGSPTQATIHKRALEMQKACDEAKHAQLLPRTVAALADIIENLGFDAREGEMLIWYTDFEFTRRAHLTSTAATTLAAAILGVEKQ